MRIMAVVNSTLWWRHNRFEIGITLPLVFIWSWNCTQDGQVSTFSYFHLCKKFSKSEKSLRNPLMRLKMTTPACGKGLVFPFWTDEMFHFYFWLHLKSPWGWAGYGDTVVGHHASRDVDHFWLSDWIAPHEMIETSDTSFDFSRQWNLLHFQIYQFFCLFFCFFRSQEL